MTKITLTAHVRQRMLERRITLRHLRIAFENPLELLPARHGRGKLISLVQERALTIIFDVAETDTRIVVTAYWSD